MGCYLQMTGVNRQSKPHRCFHQCITKELIVSLGRENPLPVAAALKLSRELSRTTACARPCETASLMHGRGALRLTGDDETGEAGHLFVCVLLNEVKISYG